jgi:hypothetical protein
VTGKEIDFFPILLLLIMFEAGFKFLAILTVSIWCYPYAVAFMSWVSYVIVQGTIFVGCCVFFYGEAFVRAKLATAWSILQLTSQSRQLEPTSVRVPDIASTAVPVPSTAATSTAVPTTAVPVVPTPTVPAVPTTALPIKDQHTWWEDSWWDIGKKYIVDWVK